MKTRDYVTRIVTLYRFLVSAGPALTLLIYTTDVRSGERVGQLEFVIKSLIADSSLVGLTDVKSFLSNELHVVLSGHLHHGIQNFDYLVPAESRKRQEGSNVQSLGPQLVLGYNDDQDNFTLTISEIPAGDCITAYSLSDIFRKDGVFQAQGGLWYNLIWGPQVIGARSKEVIAGFKTPLNCASSISIVE